MVEPKEKKGPAKRVMASCMLIWVWAAGAKFEAGWGLPWLLNWGWARIYTSCITSAGGGILAVTITLLLEPMQFMQLVVKAVFLFTKIMFPLTLRFSDSPWWRSPRNPEGRARPPRSPPRRPSIPSGWPRWSRVPPLPTVVSREVEVCSAQDRPQPRGPRCLLHFPRPWKRSRFKRLEDKSRDIQIFVLKEPITIARILQFAKLQFSVF